MAWNETTHSTNQCNVVTHWNSHWVVCWSAPRSAGRHFLHICTTHTGRRRFFHCIFALDVCFAMIRDQFRFEFSWYQPHTLNFNQSQWSPLGCRAKAIISRYYLEDRDFVTLWLLQKYYILLYTSWIVLRSRGPNNFQIFQTGVVINFKASI